MGSSQSLRTQAPPPARLTGAGRAWGRASGATALSGTPGTCHRRISGPKCDDPAGLGCHGAFPDAIHMPQAAHKWTQNPPAVAVARRRGRSRRRGAPKVVALQKPGLALLAPLLALAFWRKGVQGVGRVRHRLVGRLRPPRARNGSRLEEQAPLWAGEGSFLVDRQPASLHGFARRGAAVQVVATVVADAHPAMLACTALQSVSPRNG